jgi:hypothetical protein
MKSAENHSWIRGFQIVLIRVNLRHPRFNVPNQSLNSTFQ